MPIGFNSPARNFFLLGSSGIQTATNFFKTIDQSATTDGFFSANGIKYSSYDEKYILSGSAENSQGTSFGYLEKREEDGTLDWNNRIQSAVPSGKLDLTSLELDTNGDLIVGGLSNSAPWIAKYSNTGGLVWLSTTNTGDVRYSGIGIDSSNNYYAAGRTKRNDLSNPSDTNRSNAVVEKYDSNGNTLWGKSVSIGAENASFQKVDANDTSVICAGYIEDDVTKGYFAKYDSVSGVLQWDRTLESKEISGLGIQEKTSIEDIHVDSDGFIYLCGVLSYGEVESNTFNQSRGFITKYTPEGNQLWCREVGIPNYTGYVQYYNIKVDDNTKQVIVFGIRSNGNSTKSGLLTKVSSSGEILWHRQLLTDRVPPTLNEFQRRVGFDADASFYYIFFTDDDFNKVSGNPDEYTFGKVSSSGNGLGSFVYNPEVGIDIEYTIANIPDRIGKLQDGSVRNDSSDFISYPFNGTKIMFDDLATPVTNKKAIISDKDIILRSGSPAIRPVDFPEMNLLPTVGVEGQLKGGTFEQPTTSDLDIIFSTPLSPGIVTFDQGSNPDNTSMKNFMQNQLALATAGDTFDFLWYSDDGNEDYAELIIDNVTVTNTNTMSGVSFTYTANSYTGIPVSSPPPYSPTTITGSNVGGNYILTRYNRGPELITNGDFANSNITGWTLTGSDTRVYFSSPLYPGSLILLAYGTTGGMYQSFTTEVGKTYKVSLDSGGGPSVRIFNGSGVSGTTLLTMNTNTSGGYEAGQTETFTATSTTSTFAIVGILSGQDVLVDNISVRQTPLRVVVGDQSGNGNDVVVNSATLNAAGYWEFDGTDDKIVGPPCNTILSADCSIELWVNLDDVTTRQTIISGYDSVPNTNPDRWDFEANGGTFRGGFHDTGFFTSSTAISIGDWNHVMLVLNSSTNTLKFYLNGVEDLSQSCSGQDFGGPDINLGIGNRNESVVGPMDGEIGEVRIYPRALTAAQAFQNYNATKTKYINEAPDIAPKITSDNIVIDSNLILNYDFGNRATYDRIENLYKWSNNFSKVGSFENFWNINADEYIPGGGPYGIDAWEFALTQYSGEATLQQRILPNYPAGTVTTQRWLMRSAPGYGTQTVFHKHGRNAVYGANQANVEFDITEEWSEITTTDSVYTGNTKEYFGIGTANAGVVVQVASAQLWIGDENAKYFDTYGAKIIAPTTVKNLSSSSYTGTINGAEFDTDGYFEFPSDGTTLNEITIPNFTGFTGGNNPYSYGFWIRSSGSSADNDEVPFFYGNQAIGQALRIRYYDDGGIVLGHWGGTGYDLDAGQVVSNVLEWNHIYETYDGTTNRLYVNGVDVYNDTPNTLSIPTSAKLILGHRPSAGAGTTNSDFGGDIGELQVYNKALSATEVLQNFNATKSKYDD